jgi:hypothetical protein
VIIGVGKTKSKTTIFHPKLPNSPFPTKKPEPEKEKKKKKIQAKSQNYQRVQEQLSHYHYS